MLSALVDALPEIEAAGASHFGSNAGGERISFDYEAGQ
jgi:hypothetical protein